MTDPDRLIEQLPDGVRLSKALFLRMFSESANVAMAAREVGVHRQRIYEWRRSDPEFAVAFEHAREEAYDALEAEAWRRAVSGWEEPVFYQGEQVGLVRRFSDRLLEVLLRGARPERYKPQYRVEAAPSDSRLGELTRETERAVLATPGVAKALTALERAVSEEVRADCDVVEADIVEN